jgi:hypothetical protein
MYQKPPFFETEFFSKAFDDTRQQIRTRLRAAEFVKLPGASSQMGRDESRHCQ